MGMALDRLPLTPQPQVAGMDQDQDLIQAARPVETMATALDRRSQPTHLAAGMDRDQDRTQAGRRRLEEETA